MAVINAKNTAITCRFVRLLCCMHTLLSSEFSIVN